MQINVTQAVVLCGGLGTRLGAITKNTPKPMLLINNKPFLFYVLNQLSQYGIKHFLLLTGYLSEQIFKYFGDGSKFGWQISYSHGPQDWLTGQRIFAARKMLADHFLLLYSDNLGIIDLESLVKTNKYNSSAITLTITKKKNGNVILSNTQRLRYSKKRYISDNSYVEIGYMLVNRELLFKHSENIIENSDFSSVIELLSRKNLLSATFSKGSYLSISDPVRLALTRKYLEFKKIILIDRDGVINEKLSKGKYVTSIEQMILIEENIAVLAKLSELGYKFIVITNQACIALGLITPYELYEIHRSMKMRLKLRGIEILDIVISPDHWNNHSGTRKPNPDMFFEVSDKYNLWLEQVLYIGDDLRDCIASRNAGCGAVYITPNVDTIEKNKETLPHILLASAKLENCLDGIIKNYSEWEKLYG